jgi:N-hydroxyarylamine O-acetyltransferase
MQLAKHLERIGFFGEVEPTQECLVAVHRKHAFAIPYENLDVHLGRSLDFDMERIFEKLVLRPRGGWCYETHILLEWALREIGFDVMQVARTRR